MSRVTASLEEGLNSLTYSDSEAAKRSQPPGRGDIQLRVGVPADSLGRRSLPLTEQHISSCGTSVAASVTVARLGDLENNLELEP